MLSQAQLELRRTGIGGSEAAALIGLHPFLTLHDVYRSKKDPNYEVQVTPPMERGIFFEPAIASWYSKRTGATCSEPGTLRHPTIGKILCTPDRIALLDGNSIDVSIKSPGPWAQEQWGTPWSDDVPDYVFCQAQWELIVLEALNGIRHCHVVAPIGQDLAIYNVAADPEIQAELIDAAQKFWRDYIETSTPPPVDGSESCSAFLKARFPRSESSLLVAPPEADVLMAKLKTSRMDKTRAELQEEEAKQALQALIGAHEGMRGPGWKISWKNTKDGTKTDWEAACREARLPEELIQKHTRLTSGPRKFLPTWEKPKEAK